MKSKCPICKKPSVLEFRPFCSKRCADIDLAHWLRGDYRIEGEEEKKEENEEGDEGE
ncbi:MAG: DNA gyrase inhibitor YacG [Alphaproteobacteria bacterium 41-28]|nr:MAG: DNA gyrase inhibitor YacG [Alphaproteobacteria bacterium 41-28]